MMNSALSDWFDANITSALKARPNELKVLKSSSEFALQLQDFISDGKPAALFVTRSSNDRLFSSKILHEKFFGSYICFIKQSPIRITAENIDDEVLFCHGSTLTFKELHSLVDHVFLPTMCTPEVIDDNDIEQRDKVVLLLNRLQSQVDAVISSFDGKVKLNIPNLDQLRASIQTAGNEESRKLSFKHLLESCITGWIKQITPFNNFDIVVETTKQYGQLAGPIEEQAVWERYVNGLESIVSQLSLPAAQDILILLKEEDSVYYKSFLEIMETLRTKMVDANTAKQYLTPLCDWVERIRQQTSVSAMVPLFKGVMQSLMLIWAYSRFYHEQRNFAHLLSLLSSEMVSRALHLVGNDVLREPLESFGKIREALRLCAAFRGTYLDWKLKADGINEENNTLWSQMTFQPECAKPLPNIPYSKPTPRFFDYTPVNRRRRVFAGKDILWTNSVWPLRNAPCFQTVNYFVERCNDVLELVQTTRHFRMLSFAVNTNSFSEGPVDSALLDIQDHYKEATDAFFKVVPDVLDMETKLFESAFYSFRTTVKQLELRLAQIINHGLAKNGHSLGAQLRLMSVFEGVCSREHIQKLTKSETDRIVETFLNEIATVRQMLDIGAEPSHLPPVTNRLIFLHGLRSRITVPYSRMQAICPHVLDGDYGWKLRHEYNAVIEEIDQAHVICYDTWETECLENCDFLDFHLPVLSSSLGVTSASNKPNGNNEVGQQMAERASVSVNIRVELIELLQECRYLVMAPLKLNLPRPLKERLRSVPDLSTILKHARALGVVCAKYNAVINRLNQEEAQLLSSIIEQCDKLLARGIDGGILWADLNGCRDFVESVTDAVDDLFIRCDQIKTAVNAIREHSREKAACFFVELNQCGAGNSCKFLKDLLKMNEATIEKRDMQMRPIDSSIQRAAALILDASNSSSESPHWRYFVDKLNAEILDYLRDSVLHSLNLANQILRTDAPQLLWVEMELRECKVTFCPSLEESTLEPSLFEHVDTWLEQVVQLSGLIDLIKVKTGNEDIQDGSVSERLHKTFLPYVRADEAVQRALESTTSNVRQAIAKVLRRRDAFEELSFLWAQDVHQLFQQFLLGQHSLSGRNKSSHTAASKVLSFDDAVADTSDVELDDDDEAEVDPDAPLSATKAERELLTPKPRSEQGRKVELYYGPGYRAPSTLRELPNLDSFDEEIRVYADAQRTIVQMDDIEYEAWIRIDLRPLKQMLVTSTTKSIWIYTRYLADQVSEMLETFDAFIARIEPDLEAITGDERDTQSFMKMMRLFNEIAVRDAQMESRLNAIHRTVALLHRYDQQLPRGRPQRLFADIGARWRNLTAKVSLVKRKIGPTIQEENGKIVEDLRAFERQVLSFENELISSTLFSRMCSKTDVILLLDEFDVQLKAIEADAMELRELQTLLESNVVNFDIVSHLRETLTNIDAIWRVVDSIESDHAAWRLLNIHRINVKQLLETSETHSDMLRRTPNETHIWDVYVSCKQAVSLVKANLNILDDVRNTALRVRHWKQLLRIANSSVQVDTDFLAEITFKDVLEFRLVEHVDELNAIVKQAVKDQKIEELLKHYEEAWLSKIFEFASYARNPFVNTRERKDNSDQRNDRRRSIADSVVLSESGQSRVGSTEPNQGKRSAKPVHGVLNKRNRRGSAASLPESLLNAADGVDGPQDVMLITRAHVILDELETHQISLQLMLSSSSAGNFQDEVTKWQKRLQQIESCLRVWLAVQDLWTSLEEPFSSERARITLPAQFNRFSVVDRDFRLLMKATERNRNVLQCCSRRHIMDILQKMLRDLQRCRRSLHSYLERVRQLFPRLYLLSCDDLINTLCHGYEMSVLSGSLQRVFPAIRRLLFDDHGSNGLHVWGVENVDGDRLLLCDPVVILGRTADPRKVADVWMMQLDEAVRTSLKYWLQLCLTSSGSGGNGSNDALLPIHWAKRLKSGLRRNYVHSAGARRVHERDFPSRQSARHRSPVASARRRDKAGSRSDDGPVGNKTDLLQFDMLSHVPTQVLLLMLQIRFSERLLAIDSNSEQQDDTGVAISGPRKQLISEIDTTLETYSELLRPARLGQHQREVVSADEGSRVSSAAMSRVTTTQGGQAHVDAAPSEAEADTVTLGGELATETLDEIVEEPHELSEPRTAEPTDTLTVALPDSNDQAPSNTVDTTAVAGESDIEVGGEGVGSAVLLLSNGQLNKLRQLILMLTFYRDCVSEGFGWQDFVLFQLNETHPGRSSELAAMGSEEQTENQTREPETTIAADERNSDRDDGSATAPEHDMKPSSRDASTGNSRSQHGSNRSATATASQPPTNPQFTVVVKTPEKSIEYGFELINTSDLFPLTLPIWRSSLQPLFSTTGQPSCVMPAERNADRHCSNIATSLRQLAAFCGRPMYILPINEHVELDILTDAFKALCSSGCWLTLNDIGRLPNRLDTALGEMVTNLKQHSERIRDASFDGAIRETDENLDDMTNVAPASNTNQLVLRDGVDPISVVPNWALFASVTSGAQSMRTSDTVLWQLIVLKTSEWSAILRSHLLAYGILNRVDAETCIRKVDSFLQLCDRINVLAQCSVAVSDEFCQVLAQLAAFHTDSLRNWRHQKLPAQDELRSNDLFHEPDNDNLDEADSLSHYACIPLALRDLLLPRLGHLKAREVFVTMLHDFWPRECTILQLGLDAASNPTDDSVTDVPGGSDLNKGSDVHPSRPISVVGAETGARSLHDAVAIATRDLNLIPVHEFQAKVTQLSFLAAHHRTTIVLGPAGSGKTELIKVHGVAQRILGKHVEIQGLYLGSLDCSQLFGYAGGFDEVNVRPLGKESASGSSGTGAPTDLTAANTFSRSDSELAEEKIGGVGTRGSWTCWKRGLVGKLLDTANEKLCAKADSEHFIIIDGQACAHQLPFLEQLLTAKDRLVLPNFEQVALDKNLKLFWELSDVSDLSPGLLNSVSVLCLAEEDIGWPTLLDHWLLGRADSDRAVLGPAARHLLATTFRHYNVCVVARSLRPHSLLNLPYYRRPVNVSEKMIINLFTYLLDALIPVTESFDLAPEELIRCAVFCCLWAFGALLDFDARQHLSDWFIDSFGGTHLSDFPMAPPLGNGDSGRFGVNLFDFCIDSETKQWVPWAKSVPSYSCRAERGIFNDSFVHTVHSIQTSQMLTWMLEVGRSVILFGEQGCSKSALVHDRLCTTFSGEVSDATSIIFAANRLTDSHEIHRRLAQHIEWRHGHSHATRSNKNLICFVDDLNRAKTNVHGNQEALELIRQHLDDGGFYDPNTFEWLTIQGVVYATTIQTNSFSSTCNKPDLPADSQALSPKLLRHFAMFAVPYPTHNDQVNIFRTLLNGHFFGSDVTNALELTTLPSEISNLTRDSLKQRDDLRALKGLLETLCAVTVDLSTRLRAAESRLHYSFNLSALSSVVRNLAQSLSKAVCLADHTTLLLLWRHELEWIFERRCSSALDRLQYRQCFATSVKKCIGNEHYLHILLPDDEEASYFDYEDETNRASLVHAFSNIELNDSGQVHVKKRSGENGNLDGYEPVFSLDKLKELANEAIIEHNKSNPKLTMALYDHVLPVFSRLVRVISSPHELSHVWLVAEGCPSRVNTLMQLVAFVAGWSVVRLSPVLVSLSQIAVLSPEKVASALVRLCTRAGVRNERLLLLVSTNDLPAESCLIHLIEFATDATSIDALFSFEAKTMIVNSIRTDVTQAGLTYSRDTAWTYFLDVVKRNLRIALVSNGADENFRRLCRLYPNLVSAFNLVWFPHWDSKKLTDCAAYHLDIGLTWATSSQRRNVAGLLADMHIRLLQLAQQDQTFFKKHLTNTTFEFFVVKFIKLAQRRYAELTDWRRTSAEVVCRIERDNKVAAQLTRQMHHEQLAMTERAAACVQMLAQIGQDMSIAEQQLRTVHAQQDRLERLNKLLPKLQGAHERAVYKTASIVKDTKQIVRSICLAGLSDLRLQQRPPQEVQDLMAAIIIILKSPNADLTWQKGAKRQLANIERFLDELSSFDERELPEKSLVVVEPLLKKPAFDPELMDRNYSNSACRSLCRWVHNVVRYNRMMLSKVKPLLSKVEETRREMNDAEQKAAQLEQKRAALEERLDDLATAFEAATIDKNEQAKKLGRIRQILHGADQLQQLLADERDRFQSISLNLERATAAITGGNALAAGLSCYLGVYEPSIRRTVLLEHWPAALRAFGVPLVVDSINLLKGRVSDFKHESLRTASGASANFVDDVTYAGDESQLLDGSTVGRRVTLAPLDRIAEEETSLNNGVASPTHPHSSAHNEPDNQLAAVSSLEYDRFLRSLLKLLLSERKVDAPACRGVSTETLLQLALLQRENNERPAFLLDSSGDALSILQDAVESLDFDTDPSLSMSIATVDVASFPDENSVSLLEAAILRDRVIVLLNVEHALDQTVVPLLALTASNCLAVEPFPVPLDCSVSSTGSDSNDATTETGITGADGDTSVTPLATEAAPVQVHTGRLLEFSGRRLLCDNNFSLVLHTSMSQAQECILDNDLASICTLVRVTYDTPDAGSGGGINTKTALDAFRLIYPTVFNDCLRNLENMTRLRDALRYLSAKLKMSIYMQTPVATGANSDVERTAALAEERLIAIGHMTQQKVEIATKLSQCEMLVNEIQVVRHSLAPLQDRFAAVSCLWQRFCRLFPVYQRVAPLLQQVFEQAIRMALGDENLPGQTEVSDERPEPKPENVDLNEEKRQPSAKSECSRKSSASSKSSSSSNTSSGSNRSRSNGSDSGQQNKEQRTNEKEKEEIEQDNVDAEAEVKNTQSGNKDKTTKGDFAEDETAEGEKNSNKSRVNVKTSETSAGNKRKSIAGVQLENFIPELHQLSTDMTKHQSLTHEQMHKISLKATHYLVSYLSQLLQPAHRVVFLFTMALRLRGIPQDQLVALLSIGDDWRERLELIPDVSAPFNVALSWLRDLGDPFRQFVLDLSDKRIDCLHLWAQLRGNIDGVRRLVSDRQLDDWQTLLLTRWLRPDLFLEFATDFTCSQIVPQECLSSRTLFEMLKNRFLGALVAVQRNASTTLQQQLNVIAEQIGWVVSSLKVDQEERIRETFEEHLRQLEPKTIVHIEHFQHCPPEILSALERFCSRLAEDCRQSAADSTKDIFLVLSHETDWTPGFVSVAVSEITLPKVLQKFCVCLPHDVFRGSGAIPSRTENEIEENVDVSKLDFEIPSLYNRISTAAKLGISDPIRAFVWAILSLSSRFPGQANILHVLTDANNVSLQTASDMVPANLGTVLKRAHQAQISIETDDKPVCLPGTQVQLTHETSIAELLEQFHSNDGESLSIGFWSCTEHNAKERYCNEVIRLAARILLDDFDPSSAAMKALQFVETHLPKLVEPLSNGGPATIPPESDHYVFPYHRPSVLSSTSALFGAEETDTTIPDSLTNIIDFELVQYNRMVMDVREDVYELRRALEWSKHVVPLRLRPLLSCLELGMAPSGRWTLSGAVDLRTAVFYWQRSFQECRRMRIPTTWLHSSVDLTALRRPAALLNTFQYEQQLVELRNTGGNGTELSNNATAITSVAQLVLKPITGGTVTVADNLCVKEVYLINGIFDGQAVLPSSTNMCLRIRKLQAVTIKNDAPVMTVEENESQLVPLYVRDPSKTSGQLCDNTFHLQLTSSTHRCNYDGGTVYAIIEPDEWLMLAVNEVSTDAVAELGARRPSFASSARSPLPDGLAQTMERDKPLSPVQAENSHLMEEDHEPSQHLSPKPEHSKSPLAVDDTVPGSHDVTKEEDQEDNLEENLRNTGLI